MELALRHALTYTTTADVPVEIVARSLVANERLIHEALRVLESSAPGVQISAVRVRVDSLSNASPLKQAFAVALFMTFQKDLEQEVPAIIEKLTGQHVPEAFDTLVTVLVLMIAMAVVTAAVERVFPGKEIKKLKKEFEQKLDILATTTGLDRGQILGAINQAVTRPGEKTLLKKAAEFFMPAKLERGAAILIGAGEGVSAEAIGEIPDDINVAPDGSSAAYDLNGVVIDIHRSDRDQGKHGWRAVIESISERKVRLEFAADIEAAPLYGKTAIVGDVTVMEGLGESGELEAKTYFVRKIVQPDP